jgi:hypothetical protein
MNDQHCQSLGWINPSNADKVHCAENKPEVIKDLPPGDRCQKDEECFGNAGESKCDKNVCTTTRKETSECPDNALGEKEHKWCPLGTYCDNTNK